MSLLQTIIDTFYRKPRAPEWIQTWSGQVYRFEKPDPESIVIVDIAHALSQTCRFTGHTDTLYSVAEHCVRLSSTVPQEDAPAALLHDAAECYLTDVNKPLKQLIGRRYKRLEEIGQRVIFRKFGLDPELPVSVDKADLRMLMTEKRDLFSCQVLWGNYADIEPYDFKIKPWPSRVAECAYLSRFKQLFGRLS